jgi:gliding motility-associated-like protein
MKQRLIPILFVFLLVGIPGARIRAQKIFLTTENNHIFSVDISNNTCKAEEFPIACSNGNIDAVAMYRDTFYFVSGGALFQSPRPPSTITCKQLATGINTNCLTIDRNGSLYWINGAQLVRFDPVLQRQTVLGTIPFAATGDLVFWKNKLYLSATGGIVEVNIQDPSKSSMVLPAPGREFAGLVNGPLSCEGNRLYGVEYKAGTANLVWIDIDQLVIRDVFCSVNLNGFKLLDAGSTNETGEAPGITVDFFRAYPSCWPNISANTKLVANAFSTDGEALTYGFRIGSNNYGTMTNRKKAIELNGKFIPASTWRLTVTNDYGCEVDTALVIPEAVHIFVDFETKPDTCGAGNGAVSILPRGGDAPYTFTIEGGVPQQSAVFRSLSAGEYKAILQDYNECKDTFSFAIKPMTPPLPVASLTIIPAKGCGPVAGGELRLTYLPQANVTGASIDGSPFQLINRFTGLAIGQHRLQLKTATCLYDTLINMTLALNSGPQISLTKTHPDCKGDNGSISISAANIVSPFMVDFAGRGFSATTQYTNLGAGAYPIVLRDADGCDWSVNDTLLPYKAVAPLTDIAVNDSGCTGQARVRLVMSGPLAPYLFEINGHAYKSGGEAGGLLPGNYQARMYTSRGCLLDSIAFTIDPGVNCDTLRAVLMPSAFTPNGDGRNDVLRPLRNPTSKLAHFVFRIFNRWGQIVFESTAPERGWDGTYKGIQQPMGTYIWIMECVDAAGKKEIFQGTSVLIR